MYRLGCNPPALAQPIRRKDLRETGATEMNSWLLRATSSPSGWYELSRFGRNIGTDPLPANAAHWRKIPTDVGTVWADLNAPGTRKFSDADFPAFKGWNCFDDDPTPDSLAPSDSAGFYWASLRMAQYADRAHTLERVTVSTVNGQGAKVYYRSPAFWEASTAVNLPGSIGSSYSKSLNGFDSRCCAYGYALAVLTEVQFPNASNVLDLDFPEGYLPRRAR